MYLDEKLNEATNHLDYISIVHGDKKLDQDMDHPDRISVSTMVKSLIRIQTVLSGSQYLPW